MHMHACMLCVQCVCVHAYMCGRGIHMYICSHGCAYMCTSIYTYARLVCIRVVHMRVSICVCVVHMYVCMGLYIYGHMCVHMIHAHV